MEEKENWLFNLSMETQLAKVLETNQYTEKFQLKLTTADAKMLMEERKEELQKQGRVEFGEGIMNKLIYAFCDSAYIYQDNYQDSLLRLQEIFYLYKNESMDECSDDELIDYMKNAFEGICQGDFDYLEDTCLEEFAREIRRRARGFIGGCASDEDLL